MSKRRLAIVGLTMGEIEVEIRSALQNPEEKKPGIGKWDRAGEKARRIGMSPRRKLGKKTKNGGRNGGGKDAREPFVRLSLCHGTKRKGIVGCRRKRGGSS